MQFLEQIESALPNMRPGEAGVARHLLRDPGHVASHSLREIAAWCATSDATVLRTCRAAGFDGYQDLKYHVLRELTSRGTFEFADDHATTTPVDDMRASLSACRQALPKAATLLRRSKRVGIVGTGASCGIGFILADVLSALGKHAIPLRDEQAVAFALAPSAANLVLVAISHSGETGLVLHAVRGASNANVRTIGLTNEPASELAQMVDLLLPTQVLERPEGSFSIAPRLCQLAVLDRLIDELRRKAHRTSERPVEKPKTHTASP